MRPEFHICEDKFITDGDLSHAKGKIFFPLTDCSGVTAPRYTEYTDILKAPVVQTLMLQMRETEAFIVSWHLEPELISHQFKEKSLWLSEKAIYAVFSHSVMSGSLRPHGL